MRKTHGSKRYREHGLHASVLHRSDHSFLIEQRASHQRPELDVFDSHRHKLSVRVGPELHHEDPVDVTALTAHPRAWDHMMKQVNMMNKSNPCFWLIPETVSALLEHIRLSQHKTCMCFSFDYGSLFPPWNKQNEKRQFNCHSIYIYIFFCTKKKYPTKTYKI